MVTLTVVDKGYRKFAWYDSYNWKFMHVFDLCLVFFVSVQEKETSNQKKLLIEEKDQKKKVTQEQKKTMLKVIINFF